jgi:FkbM family methyltransferase
VESWNRSGDRRVRVLHLISDAGPHPYFALIGDHANREIFDVRLATVGPAGALQADARRIGFASFALGAGARTSYPEATLALARRLRRDRIDVLQTHLLDGSVVGLTAARLARTPAAVLTAHHSHEIPLLRRRSLTAVDRLCAGSLCDAIIAPSGQMGETLVEFHRVRHEKVHVIHHGFELDRLNPEIVDGAQTRAEVGLEGKVVLSSVGRLYWMKNQQALLRAFAEICPAAPDAVLLLAGPGDQKPLRRLAGSLGMQERVRFLGRRDDVPELLAATDLFVHPALAESFAMVIVEAMAMACPIVSTPVGIAPDVIRDGETGVLAADATVDALAAALVKALSMRDRWPAMGAEARGLANEFQAGRMVRAYETLYLDLLDTRPRRDARPAVAMLKGLRAWRPVNAVATGGIRAIAQARGRPLEIAVKHLPREGPVRTRLPNGRSMCLWSRGDDWVSNQVYWRGWAGYEPEASSLFYELAARSEVTVDVGAHVGFYTVVAALANPLAKVYAFEPVEAARRRLDRHVALNGLGNVEVIAAAVSDSNGTADFFQGPAEIPCSSGLSETQMRWHDRVRRTRVRTVALDEFLEEREVGPVGLVKIDVEGSEAEVLRGMPHTLERDRPSILCEVLPDEERGAALERLLCPCGYRFMHLTPDGPRERERIVGHPEWLNYLFTSLDQREAAILAAAHCPR